MSEDWESRRRVFAEAAAWFVTTAARVDGRWDAPGLGEWDVRALVGHTSRSLLTVEQYLTVTPEAVELDSPTAYYLATRAIAAGPGVADRGRAAGAALGEDPAAAVATIADRVVPMVGSMDGTELLTTAGGGMRLTDYLPTRSFELTVHTLDLAAALDLDVVPPAGPATEALRLVADLAVADGRAGALLLAATGRGGLPEGFSVL